MADAQTTPSMRAMEKALCQIVFLEALIGCKKRMCVATTASNAYMHASRKWLRSSRKSPTNIMVQANVASFG